MSQVRRVGALPPWGQTLRTLNLPFLPQFFQLIKARSTLSDVGEQVGELSVCGPLREFQQDIPPWAVDAPRIGKVLMDDAFKRVKQFLFRIHSARPGRTRSHAQIPVAPWRIPRLVAGVDENLRVESLDTPSLLSARSPLIGQTNSGEHLAGPPFFTETTFGIGVFGRVADDLHPQLIRT